MLSDRKFIIVCTMACIGSGRLCARGVEKLCQLGQTTQVRRKSSAAFVKIKQIGIQPLSRTLLQKVSQSSFLKLTSRLLFSAILSVSTIEFSLILKHYMFNPFQNLITFNLNSDRKGRKCFSSPHSLRTRLIKRPSQQSNNHVTHQNFYFSVSNNFYQPIL